VFSGANLPGIEELNSPRTAPADDLVRLVRDAADGDSAAWNEIVERFSGLLWATCRAYRLSAADAGDVCQLTWLRLLEHLDSIREPARLPGWLATTCRRECLILLRRNRRLQPVDGDRLLHLGSDQAGADEPVLVADRDAGLWQAFERLSERCQQILRLLVVIPESGPPSYRLAAEALGVPTGSLGPTRARCLAQLRELLDAQGISGFVADS
jgi:RNA polymerase sigma factor (sigma-70 family)